MKIVLLRHGKPALPARPWLRAAELGAWIDAYNAAGIRDSPPADALAASNGCAVVVTSDLARSVESGRALGPGLPVISESLFREAGLPFGPLGNAKLPPAVWAAFFRLRWFFGFSDNGESIQAFRERCRRAVDRLKAVAEEHESVLFIGHGLINRQIARGLTAAGWRGRGRTNIRHWGFTEYVR